MGKVKTIAPMTVTCTPLLWLLNTFLHASVQTEWILNFTSGKLALWGHDLLLRSP
jgi:hypothetical protein